MLVTPEVGLFPLDPTPCTTPGGQFPETGSGPPNQLGTVSGPSGAGKSGVLQFVGMWGVAPIQCEGFLCSVVFLTPKGSGSLGETKAATEAFLAPLPVYAMPL